MTVYAPVPAYADRQRHPRALFLIIGIHAALLAAVMAAKMDVPPPFAPTPTTVKLIPEPQVPPANPPPQPRQDPRGSRIDQMPRVIPVPQPRFPVIDSLPMPLPDPGPIVTQDPAPVPAPVRFGPRFATPESLLKPPYPQPKHRFLLEPQLRLRIRRLQKRFGGREARAGPDGCRHRRGILADARPGIGEWQRQAVDHRKARLRDRDHCRDLVDLRTAWILPGLRRRVRRRDLRLGDQLDRRRCRSERRRQVHLRRHHRGQQARMDSDDQDECARVALAVRISGNWSINIHCPTPSTRVIEQCYNITRYAQAKSLRWPSRLTLGRGLEPADGAGLAHARHQPGHLRPALAPRQRQAQRVEQLAALAAGRPLELIGQRSPRLS